MYGEEGYGSNVKNKGNWYRKVGMVPTGTGVRYLAVLWIRIRSDLNYLQDPDR